VRLTPPSASARPVARSGATRLLAAAARHFVGAATDDELLDLVRGPIHWPALLAAADREGMTGLVALQLERLVATGAAVVPLEPWRAARRRVTASNMAALAELEALRAALRRAGRQVVVLKGAALIPAAYHGAVELRPLGDVDLLVRPRELDDIVAWLKARGYRPFARSSTFLSRGPVAFDLHTEIAGSSWVARKADAFRLDPVALWRDARPLDRDDPSALALSPEHQRLHLVVHALKHSYSRLIWLVDIALMLGVVADEGALLAEARAAGAERSLAYAVNLIDTVLSLRPPDAIAGALPSLNGAERAFLRLVARRSGMEVPGELVAAFAIPGLMGKLAYLAELGFPATAVLARHYPSTPAWLLYPRRVARLAALGVRDCARLVRRRL
jgi:Uncharacterised nucleotidyltransferase